jgi:hypothetical protein
MTIHTIRHRSRPPDDPDHARRADRSILKHFRPLAEARNQGVSARLVPQLPQKTSAGRSCFPQFVQVAFRAGAGRLGAPIAGGWIGLPHLEQNFSLGSELLPQVAQAQPVRMNLANRAPIPSPAGAWAGGYGGGRCAAGGAGGTAADAGGTPEDAGGAGGNAEDAGGTADDAGGTAAGAGGAPEDVADAGGAAGGTAFLACARAWS